MMLNALGCMFTSYSVQNLIFIVCIARGLVRGQTGGERRQSVMARLVRTCGAGRRCCHSAAGARN